MEECPTRTIAQSVTVLSAMEGLFVTREWDALEIVRNVLAIYLWSHFEGNEGLEDDGHNGGRPLESL